MERGYVEGVIRVRPSQGPMKESLLPVNWSAPVLPATNPARGSMADAWGSIDAASALPFQRNANKIKRRKVNTMGLIQSSPHLQENP